MLFGGIWPAVQAQSISTYANWAYRDAYEMLIGVNGQTIRYGILGFGLVSAISVLDDPLQFTSEQGYSSFTEGFAEVANWTGEPSFAIPASVGLFGVSLLTKNQKFQDAAFTSAQTLFYATSATGLLKFLIGRTRPNESDSPYKFKPFSGEYSFPSGHATAAFSILIPWAVYYPGPITYSLVAVAGSGTAFARIKKNKHWFSDVVAGSAIGTISALILSHRHQIARGDAGGGGLSGIHILPAIDWGQRGFTVLYTLH